jgi:hypothetical protein
MGTGKELLVGRYDRIRAIPKRSEVGNVEVTLKYESIGGVTPELAEDLEQRPRPD